ncbi:MAG: cupredoxin domain-containing protein [Candidatus Limnocylindria bacterium]
MMHMRISSGPKAGYAAVVSLGLLLAACAGGTTNPGTEGAPRVIGVTMTDGLRFDPAELVVTAGETVRFEVTNPTSLEHDFVIGDETEQEHHGEEMMGGDAMIGGDAMMHDEENAVSLAPGETKELVYSFGDEGELLIGCHVDGHYAAGMMGTISVEA